MKTIKTCLLGAAFALAFASATQAADLKIGYVNYQKLLEESPQAKVAASTLENEFGPKQRELVNLQKSLSEMQDLDYAEAVSRMNQQMVSLQAAQAAYTRLGQMSLFDYL